MHKIYFVTGKGGVGKSTIAAFLARREALLGKKTLLVEMGPWSYYQKWWGHLPEASYAPQSTPYGFDWSIWTGEECLKEYVAYLVKLPFLNKIFLENNWMRSLIKLAPGLREIAFLGKVTSQIREHGPSLNYDSIVIDAVSTGHFVSLLQAPQGLRGMVKAGPVYVQCKNIIAALNSSAVETLLVTTLENFAIQETSELMTSLQKQLESPITVVANKDFLIPSISQNILDKYQNKDKTVLFHLMELSKYQEKNKKHLFATYKRVKNIPFYYQPLLEVLNDKQEIQRIYSNN